MRAGPSLLASLLAAALAALAVPADAACKKFGFTVNDYGKEGPTNDAKNLLDKHIAEWAAQNKIAEYQTGKKSVSCELFLDVILFDEHTCTASATVCWGAGVKPNNVTGGETAAADDTGAGHPPAPVRKAEALGTAPQQAAETPPAADASSAPAAQAAAPAAPATEAPTATGAPAAPAEQAAAPADVPADGPPVALTPQATPPATTGAGLETGALQAGQGLAPAAAQKAAPTEKERAAAAAAAASAAAAAERAAMAAETAANAAKEAAAAAVAASAASKGSATVPPLDHASGAKPAHTE
jgi:hypothetical protein